MACWSSGSRPSTAGQQSDTGTVEFDHDIRIRERFRAWITQGELTPNTGLPSGRFPNVVSSDTGSCPSLCPRALRAKSKQAYLLEHLHTMEALSTVHVGVFAGEGIVFLADRGPAFAALLQVLVTLQETEGSQKKVKV